MTPPPIHRRKTFWLGLLILIFLAWAWLTSYSREAVINSGDVSKLTSLTSTTGTIVIYHVQDLTGTGLPAGPGKRGIQAFTRQVYPSASPQPSPKPIHFEDITDELLPYRYRTLTIAWWFITLLHLIAWPATLALLHRRQRRLLENPVI